MLSVGNCTLDGDMADGSVIGFDALGFKLADVLAPGQNIASTCSRQKARLHAGTSFSDARVTLPTAFTPTRAPRIDRIA
jgi:hypothetical protein